MNVPFFKQSHDHTCGPATLQMVFAYYGKTESQKNIENTLDCHHDRGTSHKKMMGAVRHYGFICHERRNSSMNEVRGFLAQKIPVIVNYTEHLHDEGHYAVIVDATNISVVLNDPWHGKNFKVNLETFEKRWHNSTGRSKKWLLAVSQPPIPATYLDK